MLQLLILAVRPLLFEAVKTATASICLHGRSVRLELPYRLEIECSASAARENIHLCRQVLRLRQPATLAFTNIHYSFNAALTLELHQVLLEEDLSQDREYISFTASLLDADEGSNREFAKDCAKVLSDLACIMDKLRNTHFRRPVDPNGSFNDTLSTASDHAPLPLAQSNLAAGWNVVPSNAPPIILPFGGESHPLPQERESAYTELLSWLQNDSLQPSP